MGLKMRGLEHFLLSPFLLLHAPLFMFFAPTLLFLLKYNPKSRKIYGNMRKPIGLYLIWAPNVRDYWPPSLISTADKIWYRRRQKTAVRELEDQGRHGKIH